MSASRDGVSRKHFLLVFHNDNLRVQILLVLDDHGPHEAGRFIDVPLDRDTRNHIAEFDLSAFIRENWHIVRVPLNESFALLNCRSAAFGDHGADHDVITLKLAAFGVMHTN